MTLRAALAVSSAALADAACGRGAPPPSPAAGVECLDGEASCEASRARICRDGRWSERHCEQGCEGQRCRACIEGASRCLDDGTVERCAGGRQEREACVAAACVDGACRCAAGAARCDDRGRRWLCDSGEWVEHACPTGRPLCHSGACVRCVPGSRRCLGENTSQRCSPAGEPEVVACAAGCHLATGACVESCTPGELRCADFAAIERCADDGEHFEPGGACDAATEACDEGTCVPACAYAALVQAPSGCEFFAPPIYRFWQSGDTGGPTGPTPGDSRLVVVNPSAHRAAAFTVEGPSGSSSYEVGPRSIHAVSLDDRVSPAETSVRTRDAAVRVTSTLPIYVIQHYRTDEYSAENARSGDTAFLLPAHVLREHGTRHRVITQPHRVNHSGAQPGGFIVLSVASVATTLHVTFAGHTAPGTDLPAYPASALEVDVPLDPYEAIHFLSHAPSSVCDFYNNRCTSSPGDDLTGTLVRSDAPVAVFNGGMSRVPWFAGAHTQNQLLEQLMPTALWGDEHVVAAREVLVAISSGIERGHEQWVVLTDAADNGLRFSPAPPVAPADPVLAQPGDRIVFNSSEGDWAGYRAFRLESEKPVLVARFFYTVAGGTPEGGSTFTVERPARFWRAEYHVDSVGASFNRIQLVVPEGVRPRLDGAELSTPAGEAPAGFVKYALDVFPGYHLVEADAPIGFLAYGYDIEDRKLTALHSYSYTGPVGFGDAR